MRRVVEFVGKKQPKFSSVQPSSVNIDEMTTFIKYTLVYSVSNTNYRIVVSYSKSTNTMTILEEPFEVLQTKPLIFESEKTEQGRTNYFTNDVQTLTKYDTNFNKMFT